MPEGAVDVPRETTHVTGDHDRLSAWMNQTGVYILAVRGADGPAGCE